MAINVKDELFEVTMHCASIASGPMQFFSLHMEKNLQIALCCIVLLATPCQQHVREGQGSRGPRQYNWLCEACYVARYLSAQPEEMS